MSPMRFRASLTALVLLLMASLAHASSNSCEDALEGTVAVQANITDEIGVANTFSSAIEAFRHLERPYHQDRLDLEMALRRVADLLFTAHRKVSFFQNSLKNGLFSREQYNDFMKRFASDETMYRAGFVARYHTYASGVQRYFSTLLVSYLAVRARIPNEAVFVALDLGAGIGDSTIAIKRAFPNAHVIGADKSAAFLRLMRAAYPELEGVELDFHRPLPFNDSSMYLVTSVTAAMLFSTKAQFLALAREVNRVLQPGGYFLVEFAPHSHAITGDNVRAFAKEMRALGFEAEKSIGMRIDWSTGPVYPVLLRKTR